MLRTRLNQYRGINAHMHSYAQHERDGWSGFHSMHIQHLVAAIDALLPSGYEVIGERSLQIRDNDLESGQVIIRKPEPDVTIWDTGAKPGQVSRTSTLTEPVLTIPLVDTLIARNPEDAVKAVVIRELSPSGEESKPVTRIELLSPANKVGDGALLYWAKRDLTMHTGTVLIEIDYLHETESPVPGVWSYPKQHPKAFPYVITVSDPRPSFREGHLKIYGVRVDQVLPTIAVPLSGNETIDLNFDQVYQRTFSQILQQINLRSLSVPQPDFRDD